MRKYDTGFDYELEQIEIDVIAGLKMIGGAILVMCCIYGIFFFAAIGQEFSR